MRSKPIFSKCAEKEAFYEEVEADCRKCCNYEECIIRREERLKKVKRHKKKVARIKKIIRQRKIRKIKAKLKDILSYPIIYIIILLIAIILLIILNQNAALAEKVQSTEMAEEKGCIIQETENENFSVSFISAYEPGETYYYDLSSSDKKIIAKLVYQEARGEPYIGKVAVAAVVLNRYTSGDARFDTESIYAVVTQSGQFSSISGVTQEMLDTVPDIEQAVEDACLGWDPTRVKFADGALFFYAPAEVFGYQLLIREGIEILTIGNHNFHREL